MFLYLLQFLFYFRVLTHQLIQFLPYLFLEIHHHFLISTRLVLQVAIIQNRRIV